MEALIRERTQHYSRVFRQTYHQESILDHVVTTRWYDEILDKRRKFFQFAFRIKTVNEWFSVPNVNADLVFSELGRSLAISEEKEIVAKLNLLPSVSTRFGGMSDRFNAILTGVEDLRNRGYSPCAVFLPIDWYVEFYDWAYRRNLKLKFTGRWTLIDLAGSAQLIIHWSNKFVPFDNVYLLDKAFGEWVSKPDLETDTRLQLFLSFGQDMIAKTVFTFRVVDPDAVIHLEPGNSSDVT